MVKFNVGGSWELGCAYFESLVHEIIRLFESIITKVKGEDPFAQHSQPWLRWFE